MGIDSIGLEALLYSQRFVTRKDSVLTLGRQQIYSHTHTLNTVFNKYTVPQCINKYKYNDYSEFLFRDIGYSAVDSIDNYAYEWAMILKNMNLPHPPSTKRYDFIFDGGTMEHIFNTPKSLKI